jgi:CubicO group peptidase (beta-lactamase class C family)
MPGRAFTLTVLLLLAAPALAAPNRGTVSGPVGEKLDAYLTRLEGFGFAGSILVAKDGQILLHKGYGLADREKGIPFTPETVFDIGSITKQFTAAAILKLESEGKLKVTDPLGKYFDGAPEDKAGITLHHLLTHSAGMKDVFGDDYEEMPRDRLVQAALASQLLWPPGTRYQYSNAGYSLLAAIVEKVSGKPYETYLRETFFKPAGMEKTGYRLPAWKPEELAHGYRGEEPWGTPLDHAWAPDGPWWNLRGNGGILSTTGDLYKWYLALEKGNVLSKEEQAKAYTPHVPEDPEGSSHYGYGWAIDKGPGGTRRIAHNGGNGIFAADFQRYPDDRLVLLTGSAQSDFSSIGVAQHLSRMLFGNEPPLPPAVVAQDAAALAKLAGTYELPGGGKLVATLGPVRPGRANGLRIVPEGKDAFALLAGANAADRERYAGLEARLVNALETMRKGDYKPLHELYGGDQTLEQVTARAKETWSDLEKENGPLQKIEVLGTGPLAGGGRAVTWVRLAFEHGTQAVAYVWEGANVAVVRFVSSPAGAVFLPLGPTELAAYDPRSGAVSRVRFEMGEGGGAVLVVGEVKAKRR